MWRRSTDRRVPPGSRRSDLIGSVRLQADLAGVFMKTSCLAIFAATTLAACAQLPPEQQILNDAADALGGRPRGLAVKTLVIDGAGLNGDLGHDMTADTTRQAVILSRHQSAIDVGAARI